MKNYLERKYHDLLNYLTDGMLESKHCKPSKINIKKILF